MLQACVTKMSMVEYMCKLFYGRRGIQLTEEQFQAVVSRNAQGSRLRNIFSDLNPGGNNHEENVESPKNEDNHCSFDKMMQGWSVLNSEDWNKQSPQCTAIHFNPLSLSNFSLSFPQSSVATFSTNKHFPADSHDCQITSPKLQSSLTFSQYVPSFQEFPSSDPHHSINCFVETMQPGPSHNQGLTSLYSADSCASYFDITQNQKYFNTLSTVNLDHHVRTSHNEIISDNTSNFSSSQKASPLAVHFSISSTPKNDFVVIPTDAPLWCNRKIYKSEFFDDGHGDDRSQKDASRKMFLDEIPYQKMFSLDGVPSSEGPKHPAHICLNRSQVMSPTVDSTVSSIETSYNYNYFHSCSSEAQYDVEDYFQFSECAKNSVATDNSETMRLHNLRSFQHVCAVCGDHAACQHYGVRTCEGCKGFFKRTVQKNAVYVCLSGKNCPIDKRRRNRCQYCRFEKCLAVGMVKEVVRTDLLKGRRGRLPSKPKPISREYSASPPISFITAIVRAHVDTSPDIQNHDYSHFHKPLRSQGNQTDYDDLLNSIFQQTIEILAEWSSKLPGFNLLPSQDQQILFHATILDLIILRIAFRTEENNELIFCNGIVLDWASYKHFSSFAWIEIVREFSKTAKVVDGEIMDLSTMSCTLALCLLSYREGLQDVFAVEELQTSLVEALSKHQSANLKKRTFLPNVLSKLTELKSCSQIVYEHLSKIGGSQPNNSVINTLLFSTRHFDVVWND